MKKMFSPSKLVLAVFLMASPVLARADWSYGGSGDCGTPATAPIDGGLSLLLGAGAIAYGKKKLAESRKNKAEQAEMEK
ncbi:MAG: hypothetical protein JSS96_15205 [Bacteroidetes bacterium]|nr:hypothetical protein [Bacteroidota bacterium]